MSMTRSRPARLRPERTRPKSSAASFVSWSGAERRRALAQWFDGNPKTNRRLAVALVVLMAAFSVAPVVNNLLGKPNKDYDLWYQTGRTILRGGDVYPTDHRPFPFMYPPAAGAMLAVTSLVGPRLFVPLLLLVNSAAWIGSILLSVRLATGEALHRRPSLYAIPTLLLLPFIHDMYLLGQPNLLLLWLMLSAFLALGSGRPWSAGALVGLAAAIKAFPVMAVGYLVYRRQWKATAGLAVTLAALLFVLPLPFRGPSKTWSDMVVWTRGMVLKYDEGQIAQRPERCYSFKNQSLVAVANRLLRSVPADGERKDGWQVNVADLSFKTVNAVVVACALGLGLFYLAAMPRGRAPRNARTDAAETAMLLLMILAFSPFAFNYFYVWVLYPATVLLSRVLDAADGSPERRVIPPGLWISLAIYAATLISLRGSQAYGNLLAVDLILLGLLGWTLFHERRAVEAV
jgi:hypothetical protein